MHAEIGYIHPTRRLRPGTKRAAVAALLARPEGASVVELLAAYGLPADAPIAALHSRLAALAAQTGRVIRREGRARGARYFFIENP